MNFSKLLTMVMNQLIRRGTNWGITKGIEMASGKGKPRAEMSSAERRLEQKGREAAKMARQAAKITRKLGR